MRAARGFGCFFAAVADVETRKRVAALASALQLPTGSRLVPPQDYHITFVFVGGIPAAQVSAVRDIGRLRRIEKFSVRLDAGEYWPTANAVVAAARSIPPALGQLWRELREELGQLGWPLDPQPLRPHVTLARKVSQAPVLPAMSAFDWPVRAFCLVRSDTGGAQSAYTVVDTWQLLDNVAKT